MKYLEGWNIPKLHYSSVTSNTHITDQQTFETWHYIILILFGISVCLSEFTFTLNLHEMNNFGHKDRSYSWQFRKRVLILSIMETFHTKKLFPLKLRDFHHKEIFDFFFFPWNHWKDRILEIIFNIYMFKRSSFSCLGKWKCYQ